MFLLGGGGGGGMCKFNLRGNLFYNGIYVT